MAQFLPDAPALLAAIARLLDEHVLPVVPPDVQHQVRVAAHLAALLEREARLSPATTEREREVVGALLGGLPDDADPAAALDEHLRSDDDVDLEARAWAALVELARADLAICKPAHDRYEGR